jgi:hypothetical protein
MGKVSPWPRIKNQKAPLEIGAGEQPQFRYPVYMPKKKAPKPKAKKKKTTRREDVNQAAARILREATER